MIILDPNRHIKKAAKFIGIFVAIALVLALAFWGFQKMKPVEKPLPAAKEQKTQEEKKQDIKRAVEEARGENQPASVGASSQSPVAAEQEKKQQDIQSAVDKTIPTQTPIVSPEKQSQKAQDIQRAINLANPK
jgi:hypothetical protein